MTHGSLFSGIGGFDLAAEWMGWENIFHCEWNPFGQKVLKHHFPKSISYNDITKTDFTIHRGTIDILTGGFPCQPYSTAGKRLGKEDDRHLWPEMLRVIREVQPGWIVGENVLGIVNWEHGMVFDEVQTDLETQGYEVTPFLLPACCADGQQLRIRCYFIAYSNKMAGQSMGKRKDETRERRSPEVGSSFTWHLTEVWLKSGMEKDTKFLANPSLSATLMGFPKDWTVSPFQNGVTKVTEDSETQ